MRTPEEDLEALRQAGLWRELRCLAPAPPPLLRLEGRELVGFASNDYLGLSHHPAVIAAARDALGVYGAGSTASRSICGSLDVHHALEARLSELKGTGAALSFGSGYATAVGTLTALLERGDFAILDKLCHASLIDGARLSGATIRVYPHNHLAKLERLLRSARESAPPRARIVVVTEAVFSMEGDRAPLAELVALADRYEALLLLDEAHALGVCGAHGLGLAEELGLQDRIALQMGTLGKAAGAAGGYLAAAPPWIDLLVNKARSFIFSTAAPPAQAAAARAGLDLIVSRNGTALRKTLWNNIETFASLTGHHSASAIVPIVIGGNEPALHASRALLEAGFFVPAIRYPSVPRGTARLRVALSASHTGAHLESLAHELRKLGLTA